jgi:signal transduction histidine kinase
MGELEAFAYSLAHDLRAPARAIHGFTQLALELPPAEVGPAAVELLQRVVKAAGRMDHLIQDVLILSALYSDP